MANYKNHVQCTSNKIKKIKTKIKKSCFKAINLNLNIMGYHEWKSCIDACLNCAAICNHCAASCTKENDVNMMAKCIELDMQCATICYTAAQLMSLGSEYAKNLCSICAEICRQCGEECSKHDNEHCKECASICISCAKECKNMAA
jgi:hypothetical protein